MHENRVDILDSRTRQVIGHCTGPTWAGTCPKVDAHHDVVPCAGHSISPLGAGPERWFVHVAPGARRCPLVWSGDTEPS